MTDTSAAANTYRIDKFIVPAQAREVLLERIDMTHRVLRLQPGFVRDLIVEKLSGPGAINMLTLVEWQPSADLSAISRQVAEAHMRTGFNRDAFFAESGIVADLGIFAAVPGFDAGGNAVAGP